ncbi:hypothetical protein, partial [Shewanella hanedai]|uniref:hypothetical protein n=1 Tax=Shewanella hanedai TaxID=25 RepID=UPI001E2EF80B
LGIRTRLRAAYPYLLAVLYIMYNAQTINIKKLSSITEPTIVLISFAEAVLKLINHFSAS